MYIYHCCSSGTHQGLFGSTPSLKQRYTTLVCSSSVSFGLDVLTTAKLKQMDTVRKWGRKMNFFLFSMRFQMFWGYSRAFSRSRSLLWYFLSIPIYVILFISLSSLHLWNIAGKWNHKCYSVWGWIFSQMSGEVGNQRHYPKKFGKKILSRIRPK